MTTRVGISSCALRALRASSPSLSIVTAQQQQPPQQESQRSASAPASS